MSAEQNVSSIPDESRITKLARYNSERAHGIVHTEEWREHMAEEQAWFDQRNRDEIIAHGGEEIAPGVWMLPKPRRRSFWQVLRGL